MKLPGFKRIVTGEFATEFKELVDKLAFILNQNIEVIYTTLNKRVSLGDNIDCVIKEIDTVVVNGIPTNPATFQLSDKTRNIISVQVMRCDNLTNPFTYPTSGVFLTWEQIQTGIQINHITGLTNSNKYRLRIVAYY